MTNLKDIRLLKLFSIVSFTLICICLSIIINTPTTNGFEMSIYGVYPLYFWFLLSLSILVGVIIIFKSVIMQSELENKYWILGFFSILLANLIVLSIPLIRNYYYVGRGDVLSHIGYILYIINSGSFGMDMYPIEHIISASTFFLTGLGLQYVTKAFPIIFSFFYIFSFYLLYKEVFKDQK